MAKHDKFFEKFTKIPARKDLTFNELETLLVYLGFEKIDGSGSRIKFIHRTKNLIVSLHKPHPSNILKEYIVKQVQEVLKGFKDGNT
jgi:predicted RNA binding protein YcfA (HicA-like mRNA interferase family)